MDGKATGAPVPVTFDVYDSLGTSHQVTATFTKLPAANVWQYAITCPDADPNTLPARKQRHFCGRGSQCVDHSSVADSCDS